MNGDASIAPVVPASNQMTSGSHDTLVQRLAMMLARGLIEWINGLEWIAAEPPRPDTHRRQGYQYREQ